MDYEHFLAAKERLPLSGGVHVEDEELHQGAFPFQRDLARWAIRKGRAAIFATTGMGKTLMQLMWAQASGDRVLILAPLGVVAQTVREGEHWGISVTPARSAQEAPLHGITITNYEMLEHFTALIQEGPVRLGPTFDAVVLDESSILKSFDGKTRTRLIELFANTPRRMRASRSTSGSPLGA